MLTEGPVGIWTFTSAGLVIFGTVRWLDRPVRLTLLNCNRKGLDHARELDAPNAQMSL